MYGAFDKIRVATCCLKNNVSNIFEQIAKDVSINSQYIYFWTVFIYFINFVCMKEHNGDKDWPQAVDNDATWKTHSFFLNNTLYSDRRYRANRVKRGYFSFYFSSYSWKLNTENWFLKYVVFILILFLTSLTSRWH